MRISVLTLFPGMIEGVIQESLLKRAIENGKLKVAIYDIRDFAKNKHRQVDDTPFGGGNGMVMMVQPVFDCMEAAQAACQVKPHRVYLSPRGKTLDNSFVKRLAQMEEIVLLCGHYEGIDERISEALIDEEISLGDFVLTGGEIAALAIIDSVARFLPGVLGNEASAQEDSFNQGLLEYPQYTRPREFRGQSVPDILLSGDHQKIAKWRREQALRVTKERRPDLLQKADLTEEDKTFLNRI